DVEVLQRPRQLWARPGGTAELSCHTSQASSSVDWYKEKPDGGLNWIYRSPELSSLKRRYSGRKTSSWIFSLSISPVQREDSGVYYCSSSDSFP
uniref:Ig-like domain-containing protein n=1 Tax=Otus sunia TaxID=257818 RepID=A0A8C8ADP3_9STRI